MLAALALAMTSPAMAMDMEHDMHAEQRAEWFNEMDSNDDGMLSRAEVMADAELRFNETDADDDGMLTKEEAHENKFWHKMGENLKKEYKEMKHDVKDAMHELDESVDVDVKENVDADAEIEADVNVQE